MRNLQEYGLWLILVAINAVIVSQWVNQLTLMSGEAAGLSAGLFLIIFLASVMFLLIRGVMSWFDRQRYGERPQGTKAVKVVGMA